MHAVEECPETLAFASEPVLASLANVLAFQEAAAIASAQSSAANQQNVQARPVYAKEYDMLDIELKYGLLQVSSIKFFFFVNLSSSSLNLFFFFFTA